ncbi:protein of unknown function [Cryptosporangium aurantiacum]|uniref:DUF4185 domain-containing protein n=1 Tax=Cryptosporangium aurantiacum TaxID=134849 RepID=A0A1M7RLH4_9ACTN|nr:protein of unknown function [Cryptosporangium aurantiacum]
MDDGPDRGTLIAALVVVALGAVAILVGSSLGRDEHGTDGSFRDALPAIPAFRATELGPVREHGRVAARDNGQSARYGDRSVWVFGDTVLRSPEGFLSNSGASTTDLRASDGVTLTGTDVFGSDAESPAALITHTPAETAWERQHDPSTGCSPATDVYCGAKFAYWPGPVIADPRRARVLVFYVKLCRSGGADTPCSGPYGRALGTGIAELDMRTHRVSRLTAAHVKPVRSIEGEDPTMFFPPADSYNAAAMVVGQEAYVYGDCTDRCHLARAPLDRITDRSRWTFYTGRDSSGAARWSPDAGKAADTVLAGAAGNTVLWVPALRSWLNVYLPYGDNTLRAQIGGSPYGPWSKEIRLLTTRGKGINYAGFGHPEFAERDGLVQYLTYFQADTGAQRLVKVTFAD